MLKYKMLDNQTGVTHHYIGVLDGIFLAFYSLGLFGSGVLIDNYTSKFIVNISLLLTSLIVFLISYAPVSDPAMIFLMAINGLVQSAAFPCMISLVAIWFKKETLGSVMGLWGSCSSIGNIFGAYLTSALLNQGLTWQASF